RSMIGTISFRCATRFGFSLKRSSSSSSSSSSARQNRSQSALFATPTFTNPSAARNVPYGTIEACTFPSGRGTVPSAKKRAARRDRPDAVFGEAEVRARPRPEVLDQHIAALDHSLEHALPLGVLEVEGDAPLVAIDREVIRRHALDLRRHPRPGLVTGPRELDLDDVGAVVGEHQRAIRTG